MEAIWLGSKQGIKIRSAIIFLEEAPLHAMMLSKLMLKSVLYYMFHVANQLLVGVILRTY